MRARSPAGCPPVPGGPAVHVGRRDAGSVTAEVAIGLLSVVLVLAAVLGVLRVGQAQLACTDAARAAAREVARGADGGRVADVVARLAGGTARVETGREGDVVRVEVTRAVAVPLPGEPRVRVRAVAVAVPESPPSQGAAAPPSP